MVTVIMNIKNNKEKESIEILKITDIQEYQKLYNHAWKNHKGRILIENYRWNKTFFHWRNKSREIND